MDDHTVNIVTYFLMGWPDSLEDSFSVSYLKGLSLGAWVLIRKTSQESQHALETSVPHLLSAETLRLSSSEHKSQVGKRWGEVVEGL